LILTLAVLMFMHGMAARSQGLERRPCVAPDTPAGCASMPGAPRPPGAAPSPDHPRPRTAHIQIEDEKKLAPPKTNSGTVTVHEGTSTKTAPPQPPTDTVGPPKARE
jgi:hypothetical protein